MSLIFTLILGVSMVLTTTFIIYHYKKDSYKYILPLVLLVVIYYTLFSFPFIKDDLVAKGEEQTDLLFLIVLYFFLIFGMLSEYIFKLLSKPKKKRKKFDIGVLIAPLFISPITLIPLISAFQSVETVSYSGLNTQNIMIFLIAFEHGFLWKSILGNRQNKYINNE